ncbi:MAG: class I SAM-dependent methyltransferase [Vampirovibrionia bacterium]
MLFLQGRFVETSDFQRSYEALASSYDNEWYVHLDKVTTDVVAELAQIQPQCILDAGCGTGSSTFKLRGTFSDSYIAGLDFSPSMLAEAKKKFSKDRALLVRDSLENGIKRFSNNQFDLVTCFWSLGYAKNKAVYKQLNRILADKGYLFILTNKRNTLKEVRQSMKYTMFQHIDMIDKVPLHKFPKDKQHLLDMLGSNYEEIKYGEGSFSINLADKKNMLDWILNTGILAGYEYILDLRKNKPCRDTFVKYFNDNFSELTHNYMWLLVQKK